jgi:hypothetical protein
VAQYSVHAIAGLEPDYGIHFPNIRSPEGWLKDNARSSGVTLRPEGQFFRKGCQTGFTLTRANNLNPGTGCRFKFIHLCTALINFSYLNLNSLARLIFGTRLKNVFWPNLFVGVAFQILDIQQYASGFKLGPAAILNQNPILETGSILKKRLTIKRLFYTNV